MRWLKPCDIAGATTPPPKNNHTPDPFEMTIIPVDWHIQDEWSNLEAVMVGTGVGMGPAPQLDETFDPQSRKHVIDGTYPSESNVVHELEHLASTFEAHGVRVLRPDLVQMNQVFTRDIGIVIGNQFIMTHMVEDRVKEQDGLKSMLKRNPGEVLHPPASVQMEGGDVMPMGDEIWVGYADDVSYEQFTTARTNTAALDWLTAMFPRKKVLGFELVKSDVDPLQNALHLDCCLAPLGRGHLLIHKAGFKRPDQLESILSRYHASRVMDISAEEMARMHCNVFSLSPDTVLSGLGFERTNHQMKQWGYQVIEINLTETSKMGGLLRCSTMPLRRKLVATTHPDR